MQYSWRNFRKKYRIRLKTFQSTTSTPRTEFWLNFGCILAAFWLIFDWILTAFRLNFDCVLTAFWLHFGCILTAFWLHFDFILTAFWLDFDCILTVFWLYFDWILTTFLTEFNEFQQQTKPSVNLACLKKVQKNQEILLLYRENEWELESYRNRLCWPPQYIAAFCRRQFSCGTHLGRFGHLYHRLFWPHFPLSPHLDLPRCSRWDRHRFRIGRCPDFYKLSRTGN